MIMIFIIFILIPGVQSTESNARKLKDLDVFIIALGIGRNVNSRELQVKISALLLNIFMLT